MFAFPVLICLLGLVSSSFQVAPEVSSQEEHCVSTSDIISNRGLRLEVQWVAAETGDKVVLQCRHCDKGHALDRATEKDDSIPRIWYERRFGAKSAVSPLVEVPLGVKAPKSANRIYTTSDHKLVIQDFQPDVDGDIFECHGLRNEDFVPIRYFVDELKVLRKKGMFVSGNWSAFRAFEHQKLQELAEAVQDQTGSDHPSVLMQWGEWSACYSCHLGTGKWWRRGHCTLSAPSSLKFLPFGITTISCRSTLIDSLHLNAEYLKMFVNVPDFILYDSCECYEKGVRDIVKEDSVDEKFRRNLMQGDSLQILCPTRKSNLSMQIVEWTKGLDLLPAGEWTRLGRKSRLRVDVLGSLLIEHAEREVEGQYTCRAGPIEYHFFVTVQQKSVLTSPEFHQSMLILTTTIIVCALIYCSYLCLLCLEPRQVRYQVISDDRRRRKEEKIKHTPVQLQSMLSSVGEVGSSPEEEYDADDDSNGEKDEWVRFQPLKTEIKVVLQKNE